VYKYAKEYVDDIDPSLEKKVDETCKYKRAKYGCLRPMQTFTSNNVTNL